MCDWVVSLSVGGICSRADARGSVGELMKCFGMAQKVLYIAIAYRGGGACHFGGCGGRAEIGEHTNDR